jgi:hypothetical protein
VIVTGIIADTIKEVSKAAIDPVIDLPLGHGQGRPEPHRFGTFRSAFTLLEMIVVLAVLDLTLGLVIGRGPMHNPRVAAREVARALRPARSRAIRWAVPFRSRWIS